MALLLSETFAAGIPSGFATAVVDTGTLTATWDAGGAVDLSKDGFNGAWRIDASPGAPDLRVVLDVELLSADNGGSSASGLGVAFKAASEAWAHVVFLATESGQIGRSRGSAPSPVASAVDEGNTLWPLPSLVGQHTLSFACLRRPDGAGRQYQVHVDGALLYASPIATVPYADDLTPWIFLRDSAWRLHQIEVYSDAAYIDMPARLSGPVLQLPPRTWAPVGYRIDSLPMRYDSAFGGRMVLSGYTEIDGTPPTRVGPRRVLVLDQLTGRLLRETWSDASGWWEVRGLANGLYIVVSPDSALLYDPAALSDVVPDPLPP
jgi:hypothetical protein